mmetsp:Transcript_24420/g.48981  ORF Transcript_24420/g.48981 Transcript_24420/m.48981 type:complete len:626 (+) Transcript_24420:127-2004(+)
MNSSDGPTEDSVIRSGNEKDEFPCPPKPASILKVHPPHHQIDSSSKRTFVAETTEMTELPSSVLHSATKTLAITFPRCSICHTEWFAAFEDPSIPREKKKQPPSVENLLPMPICKCTTRLAIPPLPPPITFTGYSESRNESDIMLTLSEISSHRFNHLALCRKCLEKRIATTNEVQEHEYHDNRPNGQPNVSFSLDVKCVQCQQKFLIRPLQRLLEQGRKQSPYKSTTATEGRGRNRSKKSIDWFDAVEATINLVKWVKMERRKGKRRARRERKEMNAANHLGNTDSTQEKCWWKKYGCCSADGYGSSDACYSDYCNSDEDSLSDEYRPSKKRGPELEKGELLDELKRKDPKFRLEKEDEEYVKTIIDIEEEEWKKMEEKDQKLAQQLLKQEDEEMKETERRDRELAEKLQSDSVITPMRTRSRKLPDGVSSTIVDALKSKRGPRGESDGHERVRAKGCCCSIDLTTNDESEGNEAPKPAKASLADEEITPVKRFKVSSLRTISQIVTTRTIKSPTHQTFNGQGKKPLTEQYTTPMKRTSDKITATLKSPLLLSSTAGKQQIEKKNVLNQSAHEGPEVNQNDLKYIVAMGFLEEIARKCLRDADGDVDLAVSMLLSDGADCNSSC